MTGLKLAPSSAAVVLGYVSSVFRFAVQDRIIPSNPAEGARPPAARKAEVLIPELPPSMSCARRCRSSTGRSSTS